MAVVSSDSWPLLVLDAYIEKTDMQLTNELRIMPVNQLMIYSVCRVSLRKHYCLVPISVYAVVALGRLVYQPTVQTCYILDTFDITNRETRSRKPMTCEIPFIVWVKQQLSCFRVLEVLMVRKALEVQQAQK